MDRASLQVYIDQFITFLHVEKHASPHTITSYESDLRQFMDFWENIETRDAQEIFTVERVLQRYIVALFYKKLSKASLSRKISSLRSLKVFLSGKGVVFTLTVKMPQLDRKLPETLSVEEISYLLDEIKPESLPSKYPQRDKAILELLYATGVRCAELIAIKLSDIDFHEYTIRVLGKGRKERIVLFGQKAYEQIMRYLEQERAELVKSSQELTLFVNRFGRRLTARSVQRIMVMFRKCLKIKRHLTPHKIRHSFATHLLHRGVNLRVIQELLGHSSISSTEIYTHISNQQLAELCEEKHPLSKRTMMPIKRKK